LSVNTEAMRTVWIKSASVILLCNFLSYQYYSVYWRSQKKLLLDSTWSPLWRRVVRNYWRCKLVRCSFAVKGAWIFPAAYAKADIVKVLTFPASIKFVNEVLAPANRTAAIGLTGKARFNACFQSGVMSLCPGWGEFFHAVSRSPNTAHAQAIVRVACFSVWRYRFTSLKYL